jgi:hypothetical protein
MGDLIPSSSKRALVISSLIIIILTLLRQYLARGVVSQLNGPIDCEYSIIGFFNEIPTKIEPTTMIEIPPLLSLKESPLRSIIASAERYSRIIGFSTYLESKPKLKKIEYKIFREF